MQAGGLTHYRGQNVMNHARIDNQLRGRSGRQGDPGSSRFYLSLEDGLMRIYLNEGKLNMMRKPSPNQVKRWSPNFSLK